MISRLAARHSGFISSCSVRDIELFVFFSSTVVDTVFCTTSPMRAKFAGTPGDSSGRTTLTVLRALILAD